MALSAPPRTRADRRRVRSLVALCRARLRATRAGRLGRALGTLCGAGFAVAAVGLRIAEGAEAPLAGLAIAAAHALPWVAGAPLAFAAAADRSADDRRDGIEALAAARGLHAGSVESARALAAMGAIAWAVGAPLVVVALLAAALAGGAAGVAHGAELALEAAAFAVVTGATLGLVSAICGRLGRRRGRWLLVAVVVGPWALASLAGHDQWSIPGALGAVLDLTLAVSSRVALPASHVAPSVLA